MIKKIMNNDDFEKYFCKNFFQNLQKFQKISKNINFLKNP